jgi:Fic family protein
MNTVLARISEKKTLLDSFRPLPAGLEKSLYTWARNELTYTSNAIEGNTLTSSQTAIIINDGLSVGGKSLTEIWEAVNHAKAVDFITDLATHTTHATITLEHILSIHHLILHTIDPTRAGVVRDVAVRISGSRVPRPNFLKLPELMATFIKKSTRHRCTQLSLQPRHSCNSCLFIPLQTATEEQLGSS